MSSSGWESWKPDTSMDCAICPSCRRSMSDPTELPRGHQTAHRLSQPPSPLEAPERALLASRPRLPHLDSRFTIVANRSYFRYFRCMNSYDRFMPELFRIVGGALRLDVKRVRNYTNHLADKLEKDGDHRTSSRLRQLLAETDRTLRPAGSSALTVPVDSESRFPLPRTGIITGSPRDTQSWRVGGGSRIHQRRQESCDPGS